MKKTLNLILFAAAAMLSFLPQAVDAADLHAIIVVDTIERKLSIAREISLKSMKSEVQQIAKHAELNLNQHVFSGKELHSGDVIDTIKKLQFDRDDTIIFYYNGHGYRTKSSKTYLPVMLFEEEGIGVAMESVLSILQEKQARLLMVLSDTCNELIDPGPKYDWLDANWSGAQKFTMQNIGDRGEMNGMTIGMASSRSLNKDPNFQGYKALFRDFKGTIVGTSSAPGQYTWRTAYGNFFTKSLLRSISVESESSKPQWERLLKRSMRETKESQNIYKQMNQDPIFVIMPG